MATGINWTNCSLGDVVNLKRGYDLPERHRVEGAYPIVSSSGVTGSHNVAMVKGPGVVTGRYGTLGQVFYVRRDFWPLNTSLYVQDFKGNCPLFISYLLQTLNFGQRSGAAAVPGVNRNALHMLRIKKPDLSTQRKIAAILSAYDDLIENNLRRIKVMDDMARSLYREWLVKFRFPGHEQAHYTNSSLGQIPVGWKLQRLDELCSAVLDGDWIETKDQGGSNYRLLQISNIGLGDFVETGKFRYVTQETFDRLRCTEIRPDDLLIARMPSPIGRGWLARKMPWRIITAVDVAIARPDLRRISPVFLLHFWNQPANLAAIEKQSSGTTRLRITRRELCALPIPTPPLDLQEQFSAMTRPLLDLSNILRDKNTTLRRTRDLLLPRLVSGELDVSELDIAISEEADS
ncbi:MAG: restriction endonuclease subunit S [Syntrophobacteraceae bacterium]